MGLHFIIPIKPQNYFFSFRNTKKIYKKTNKIAYLIFNHTQHKKRGAK